MRLNLGRRTCNLSLAVNVIIFSSNTTSVVVFVLIEIHCQSGVQMVSYNVTGNTDSLKIQPHPVQGHPSSYKEVSEVGPVRPNPKACRACVTILLLCFLWKSSSYSAAREMLCHLLLNKKVNTVKL